MSTWFFYYEVWSKSGTGVAVSIPPTQRNRELLRRNRKICLANLKSPPDDVSVIQTGSMSTTPNDLFLIASSLASASPVGSQNVRAAQAHCRVPVGAWVYPGSNEKRDDVIVALAKCGVVLLGETHDQAEHHRWQLH